MKKIVIVAGGTGGHIFPALSVALEIERQKRDATILWIGTTRNREQELCERHNIPLETLNVSGLQGGPIARIKALWQFLRATIDAVAILGGFGTDAVIAFGGYVCAPVLLAARLRRIPYFIHEQNAIAGRVNRFFLHRAKKVFLSFSLDGSGIRLNNDQLTGMPIRQSRSSYADFAYPAGLDRTKKTVMITGGSQGSLDVNRSLVDPVKRWLRLGYQVVWHTGTPSLVEITDAMKDQKGVFIFENIDDMYPFYACARVVVGRSGASTLAEVAYFGLPVVMVPLPWSSDNHQWVNAGLVEAQGWGIRIKQGENSSNLVQSAVERILSDDSVFEHMSKKAIDNAPVDAAAAIVKAVFDVVEKIPEKKQRTENE